MTFSEAWLEQHQKKMSAMKSGATPVASASELIEFRLLYPFKLLNETMRLQFIGTLRTYKRKLHRDIAATVTYQGEPMTRARVTITRFSVGEPDKDGLYGGAKPLIDCLLPKSKAHPLGLGYVVDDSPVHMTLEVISSRVSNLRFQRTEVRIERMQ